MAYAFGPPFVNKPARELLGEELLKAGNVAEARHAFELARRKLAYIATDFAIGPHERLPAAAFE